MSTEPRHITLTREDDWSVARDDDMGVASQGRTREAALDNLDEAVAATKEAQEADTPSPEPGRFWMY